VIVLSRVFEETLDCRWSETVVDVVRWWSVVGSGNVHQALTKKPCPLHLAGSSEWLHFDVGRNVFVCEQKEKRARDLYL
jgi:hypothetical protein